jgi:hypothetical protein
MLAMMALRKTWGKVVRGGVRLRSGGALVHGGEKNGGRKWFSCSGSFEGSRELDDRFAGACLLGLREVASWVRGRLVYYTGRRQAF